MLIASMGLFTGRKQKESAPQPAMAGGERVYSLGPTPQSITAREAFAAVTPYVEATGASRRLFLILSGANLNEEGRADEWQFHYIFPNDQCETVYTVMVGAGSPVAGCAALIEVVTPWPPPGSTQEAMLQFQGPAARLVVEQQWTDRIERLPGLPEQFVDSTVAVALMKEKGSDLQLDGESVRLKGRTPPGGYPVWEMMTGFEVLRTPFTQH